MSALQSNLYNCFISNQKSVIQIKLYNLASAQNLKEALVLIAHSGLSRKVYNIRSDLLSPVEWHSNIALASILKIIKLLHGERVRRESGTWYNVDCRDDKESEISIVCCHIIFQSSMFYCPATSLMLMTAASGKNFSFSIHVILRFVRSSINFIQITPNHG